MTDKEFRRLKRVKLIEIIYELQESEARLQKEVEFLKKRLETEEKRRIQEDLISQAVLELNNVLLSARSTADQFFEELTCLRNEKSKGESENDQKEYR